MNGPKFWSMPKWTIHTHLWAIMKITQQDLTLQVKSHQERWVKPFRTAVIMVPAAPEWCSRLLSPFIVNFSSEDVGSCFRAATRKVKLHCLTMFIVSVEHLVKREYKISPPLTIDLSHRFNSEVDIKETVKGPRHGYDTESYSKSEFDWSPITPINNLFTVKGTNCDHVDQSGTNI